MKEINVDLYNDFGNKSEEYDDYLISVIKLFRNTEFYDRLHDAFEVISNAEDRIQDIINCYLNKDKM